MPATQSKATPFEVGVTYDIVTEESAEQGEFAESGWESDPMELTLGDTLATCQRYAPFDSVSDSYNGMSLYESDSDLDFGTGESIRRAVHIKGSPRAIRRLLAILKARHALYPARGAVRGPAQN